MQSLQRLPSLASLRSFESAARHQSYTLAAEELGVTQGAISRQVRDLEMTLGVALFRRAGRTVRLTEAGHGLAGRLRGDLDRLRRTIAQTVAAGEGAQILSLAVLPTFGARWLVPRLAAFRAAHPGIELSVVSRSEPFDLAAEGVDLAIHFGRADWPGATLTPLGPEALVSVAAPALVKAHGIASPRDMFGVPLLHLATRPGLWTGYRRHMGFEGQGGLPGAQFDQFSMVIAAAVAGLGAAILPEYLVEAERAEGALTVIGHVPSGADMGYHLAVPDGLTRRDIALFKSWILGQIGQFGPARPE